MIEIMEFKENEKGSIAENNFERTIFDASEGIRTDRDMRGSISNHQVPEIREFEKIVEKNAYKGKHV